MQRTTATKRRPAESNQPAATSLYGQIESAMQAKRLSAEEAFTLLKIEQALLAKPDGAFAELLVAMLSGPADSNRVPTDAEYADVEAIGKETA